MWDQNYGKLGITWVFGITNYECEVKITKFDMTDLIRRAKSDQKKKKQAIYKKLNISRFLESLITDIKILEIFEIQNRAHFCGRKNILDIDDNIILYMKISQEKL